MILVSVVCRPAGHKKINLKSYESYACILEGGAAMNSWLFSSVTPSAFQLYLEQVQIKLELI